MAGTLLRVRWPRNPRLHDAFSAWVEAAAGVLDGLVAAGEPVPERHACRPDWVALVRQHRDAFHEMPAFVRVVGALEVDPHIGPRLAHGVATLLAEESLLAVLGDDARPVPDAEAVEREAYWMEDAFGPQVWEHVRVPVARGAKPKA